MKPGRDRTGGGALEAAAGLAGRPATGGIQAPRTAPAPHAGVGLRLLAGQAPWVYAAPSRSADPEDRLYRMPAFNVFRDGRVCPGSHRFPEEVGLIPESYFPSFFALTGDTREWSKKHPENLHALWEELDGKTEYPLEALVTQYTVAHAMAVSEGRLGYGYR